MEVLNWIRELPWTFILVVTVIGVVMQLHQEQKRREKWERSIGEDIDEIAEWLTEIDPRIVEEKLLLEEAKEAVEKETLSFAPMEHMELVDKKKAAGERTVLDPLRRRWRHNQ